VVALLNGIANVSVGVGHRASSPAVTTSASAADQRTPTMNTALHGSLSTPGGR